MILFNLLLLILFNHLVVFVLKLLRIRVYNHSRVFNLLLHLLHGLERFRAAVAAYEPPRLGNGVLNDIRYLNHAKIPAPLLLRHRGHLRLICEYVCENLYALLRRFVLEKGSFKSLVFAFQRNIALFL